MKTQQGLVQFDYKAWRIQLLAADSTSNLRK